MVLDQWTEGEFFDQLKSDPVNKNYLDVAERILRFAEDRGIREWSLRRGGVFAAFTTTLINRETVHRFFSATALTRFPDGHPQAGKVWGANGVEILFQFMAPPFDLGSEKQQQVRDLLNQIPGVSIPMYYQRRGKRPNIPFSSLQDAQALQEFFRVIDWMMAEIRLT